MLFVSGDLVLLAVAKLFVPVLRYADDIGFIFDLLHHNKALAVWGDVVGKASDGRIDPLELEKRFWEAYGQ